MRQALVHSYLDVQSAMPSAMFLFSSKEEELQTD